MTIHKTPEVQLTPLPPPPLLLQLHPPCRCCFCTLAACHPLALVPICRMVGICVWACDLFVKRAAAVGDGGRGEAP